MGKRTSARKASVFWPGKIGKNAFLVRVTDASMSPEFLEGDYAVVDPDVKPKEKDFVVVGTPNIMPSIRQMRRDKKQIIYSSFDGPAYIVNPEVFGVVVDQIRSRRRPS